MTILSNVNSNSDAVWEYTLKIICYVVDQSILSYKQLLEIIDKLIERSNCADLDQYAHLPEDARPTPS